MSWLHLVLVSFAAFTVWEWVIIVLPFSLPAAVQPLAVVGLAYGAQYLPDQWLVAVAAAGAVALLHLPVRGGVVEATPLRFPRRRRHPETGRRVPDLP